MQVMLPTYDIQPTYYMGKIKDKDGKITGEEPKVQFTVFEPVQYNVRISEHAKNPADILQKLVIASDNGDQVKAKGNTQVRRFGDNVVHYFDVVEVDYTPKAKGV